MRNKYKAIDSNLSDELANIVKPQDYDKLFEGDVYDDILTWGSNTENLYRVMDEWVYNTYIKNNPKYSSLDKEEVLLETYSDNNFTNFAKNRIKQIDELLYEHPELQNEQYNSDDFVEAPDTDWLDDDEREPMKNYTKADQSEVDAAVMDMGKLWDNMAELTDVVNNALNQYEGVVRSVIKKMSSFGDNKEAGNLLIDELNGVNEMKKKIDYLGWTKKDTLRLKEEFLNAFEAGVKNE